MFRRFILRAMFFIGMILVWGAAWYYAAIPYADTLIFLGIEIAGALLIAPMILELQAEMEAKDESEM